MLSTKSQATSGDFKHSVSLVALLSWPSPTNTRRELTDEPNYEATGRAVVLLVQFENTQHIYTGGGEAVGRWVVFVTMIEQVFWQAGARRQCCQARLANIQPSPRSPG